MPTNRRPPITRIQNSSRSRKSIRKVMLKPAMAPYSASAVAAPNPEIRPERRPLRSVREAHSTFTGPTGTAIAKPAMKPLDSNHRPINSPSILISLPQVGGHNAGSCGTQAEARCHKAAGPVVMNFMKLGNMRVNVCAGLALLTAAAGFGQTPAASPAFEVASVKPAAPPANPGQLKVEMARMVNGGSSSRGASGAGSYSTMIEPENTAALQKLPSSKRPRPL